MTVYRQRREAGQYRPDVGWVAKAEAEVTDDLDAMTKDELLRAARDRGLQASAAMTKAEIRAVLED
ncbi:MAG TPA: hypothetical protein VFQ71_03900 [Gaiellales bacterium]|jgi:hypothetical protein|nr:hypothetical protein [Gaiellales bacterium]